MTDSIANRVPPWERVRKVVLELDDEDFDIIQEEFTRRQIDISKGFELPEGYSCLRGAMVAEIVRDLIDYRHLWEADNLGKE